MSLNRDKMREYQRNRRRRLKKTHEDELGLNNSCKPDVNQSICKPVNPECKPDVVNLKGITYKQRSKPVNLPANYGQPDCQCKHCQQNRRSSKPLILNHGPHKTADQLQPNEVNRVSLPGDVDYDG